ncbi:MAG: Asp-tRNA(Asn)/Glu-tRNA(Gln) amidotransferase subunit GatB [Candidatus Gracilibacteria bacterium]|nr:Asp-tRNA(Asn)/Glu-tRNA(Gln) amidotransferase subunit GatB [bacterium]MDZ4217046.1 Asp-tRNA(Asn)/Glu-tRNA(Gln) amidotransferase subunit GatB [Candidatus Gracilibacteria bacterium]
MDLETIIGLEVHAQIATQSKLWCACSNDDFDAEPNMLTCPVCLGYPGALPVLNKKALEWGLKTALALNCSIPEVSKFDRKNYFYPDLPMGYQISQYDEPISVKGRVSIVIGEDKVEKEIGITRLHLENDAGKLMHEGEWSLVDFNRSGSPLMEIVSEPDLRSPEEAKAYAEELQKILQTVGSSEANMYKGQMRFDASVSLRPVGESKLYPRAEIKNLNSFRSLEAALHFEIRRQRALWEEGNPPDRETTVGWIEEEQRTQMMREKESAADYRYFPEPDLPPLKLEKAMVEKLKAELPELPAVYRVRLRDEFGLSDEEAEIAVSNPNLGRFFEQVAEATGEPKQARTFVFSVLLSHLKEDSIDVSRSKVQVEHVVHLITAIQDGKISASVAKEVLEETYLVGKDPLVIIQEKGLEQVSDADELERICDQVIAENEKIVEDYKNGKERAFGALIGKVMAATKGQANPQMVTEMMRGKVGS